MNKKSSKTNTDLDHVEILLYTKQSQNFYCKAFYESLTECERDSSYSLNIGFCLVLTRIGMLNRHEKKKREN